jgi:hypothetical protein
VFSGASTVKPVQVGSVLLFADYHGKTIRELVYDLNQDGYIAPDLSILSEHLLKAGIVEMAYQATPESVIWIVLDDGSLVTLTYEREQKIVAFMPQYIAPGDTDTEAIVESVCCIPGTGRDEVWIVVKRTIDSTTKRYIETLSPEFDGLDTEDGIFLDSALTYSGTAVNIVTGINHLIGQTVSALVNGKVFTGLTVAANGSITIPNEETGTVVHVGKGYQAWARTLAITEAGQKDGTALSRRKRVLEARPSLFETLSFKVKGITAIDAFDVIRREDSDPVDAQMNQKTGIYPTSFDGSWRDDGEFIFYSDDPLPATLRGFILAVTGEP